MKEVPLYDARNGLSALVAEVEATGEPIVITRHGRPAVRLSPISMDDRGEMRVGIARALLERLAAQRTRGNDRPSEPSWEELKAQMDEDRA